jgi:RNA polymerase sigma-70 factor (ECF subfamily)
MTNSGQGGAEDPADLAGLFDRHVRPLLRYAAARVGPDAAEDVVAEAFLIAYAQRSRYDPARASALTWLYGIATNVAHRHRRVESRHLAAYARSLDSSDVDSDHADAAAGRADAQSQRRAIAVALARLPTRQRDVILLYAVAGLEYAEIASALGIPLGSVQSALHRARTRLRLALDPLADRPQPVMTKTFSGGTP